MASTTAGAASSSHQKSDADRHVKTLARQLRTDSEKCGHSAGSLTDCIRKLREEQIRQRIERRTLQKELKNAARRKRRLKKKARELSNKDLMEVLLMRDEGQQESVEYTEVEPLASSGDAGQREVEPLASSADSPLPPPV